MNITPVGYQNNIYSNQYKNAPSFGAIYFTDAARALINEHLYVADFKTRATVMKKLTKIVEIAQNLPDILVDAPVFVKGMTAKVSARNPVGKRYDIKTFIQSQVYDIKFLEDALKEAQGTLNKSTK